MSFSVHVRRVPSATHVSVIRGRDSSNSVRSTAPSAALRALAAETALRAAIVSLRIENANPLAITVSRIVSQSARTSAMPRCSRIGRDRSIRGRVALTITSFARPNQIAAQRSRVMSHARQPASGASRGDTTSGGQAGPCFGSISIRISSGKRCVSSQ